MKKAIGLLTVIAFAVVGFLPMSASAATTPTPVVASIALKNGAYKTTINGKSVTLKPFSGYSGSIWAKRVSFGSGLGSAYLFMQRGSSSTASVLKYYNTNIGSMRTLTPFYGNHKKGYNVDAIVQPKTKKVYIAFGTKATGASARIVEIGRKGNTQVNNPTVAETAEKGVVLVKFLKLYANEYGLATMIADNPSTLKVWRYSAKTHRFDQDTSFDTSVISTAGNVLKLT